MQLSLEKRLERRKWINHTPCQPITSYQTMDCLIKWGNQFINSTKSFSSASKRFQNVQLSCNGEKAELLLMNLSQKKHKKQYQLPSIGYPYFAKIFKFFVAKFKFLRKLSDLSLLLGVTNITLALRFIHDFIFSTAKAANFKEISQLLMDQFLPRDHGEEFSPIFQILIFQLQIPVNEIRGPNSLESVHVFSTVWLH